MRPLPRTLSQTPETDTVPESAPQQTAPNGLAAIVTSTVSAAAPHRVEPTVPLTPPRPSRLFQKKQKMAQRSWWTRRRPPFGPLSSPLIARKTMHSQRSHCSAQNGTFSLSPHQHRANYIVKIPRRRRSADGIIGRHHSNSYYNSI